MVIGRLPDEGELRVGSVSLPAGKWVHAGFEDAIPVAWITREAVPDAGRVWSALSSAHQQTGLVPFLLGTLYGDTTRPWDQEEFSYPADPADLDRMDAAGVLSRMWDGEMPSDEEDEEEDEPVQVGAEGVGVVGGVADKGGEAVGEGRFLAAG